jgi:hypothetical protein
VTLVKTTMSHVVLFILLFPETIKETLLAETFHFRKANRCNHFTSEFVWTFFLAIGCMTSLTKSITCALMIHLRTSSERSMSFNDLF